jgi:hypothetical protein
MAEGSPGRSTAWAGLRLGGGIGLRDLAWRGMLRGWTQVRPHTHGFVILPGLIPAGELAPAVGELGLLFPSADGFHDGSDPRRARYLGRPLPERGGDLLQSAAQLYRRGPGRR